MLKIFLLLIIVSIINFILNLNKWLSNRKKAGEINFQWSSRLDPRILRNKIFYIFLAIYLIVSFVFLMYPPIMFSDFSMLIFLVLIFSFSPRWNVAISDDSIIIGTLIISKRDVIEKRIFNKGNKKYLELKWASNNNDKLIKEKVLPMPPIPFDIE